MADEKQPPLTCEHRDGAGDCIYMPDWRVSGRNGQLRLVCDKHLPDALKLLPSGVFVRPA